MNSSFIGNCPHFGWAFHQLCNVLHFYLQNCKKRCGSPDFQTFVCNYHLGCCLVVEVSILFVCWRVVGVGVWLGCLFVLMLLLVYVCFLGVFILLLVGCNGGVCLLLVRVWVLFGFVIVLVFSIKYLFDILMPKHFSLTSSFSSISLLNLDTSNLKYCCRNWTKKNTYIIDLTNTLWVWHRDHL